MLSKKVKMINHKLLTLFEGKCWHEPDRRSGSAKCIHCGLWIDMDDVGNLCKAYNPDYSSPNTYIPFLQWFWKERKEMWKVFYWWGYDEYLDAYRTLEDFESFQEDYSVWSFSLTDDNEPRIMVLLSEWLALPETRYAWGESKCPNEYCENGQVLEGDHHVECGVCNGTGRIIAEWAKEA